jgi:hypothetical protein
MHLLKTYPHCILWFVTLATLIVISTAKNANSDTWLLPTKKTFYSNNKKFRVEIVPRPVESQLRYFEDKVADRTDPGLPPHEGARHPRATFSTRRRLGYSKIRSFPLVNEVAPVTALVSDSGDYLVTFDNWHALGYGEDVVAIYHTKGDLVAHVGLDDLLTEVDIETLPHSVSSIHWGGVHRIDVEKGELILQVVADGLSNFGLLDHRFIELRVDLATGRPLQPRSDRLPQLRVVVEAAPAFVANVEASAPPGASADARRCNAPGTMFDASAAVAVSSEQMFQGATAKVVAVIPYIARAARIQDQVVVEVTFDSTGTVRCARAVSGHGLLRGAAVQAALQWKFAGLLTPGTPVGVGWIAFDFRVRPTQTP